MFAIIQTGGKQYKVKAGDELSIELVETGDKKILKLDRVLLCAKDDLLEVGRPTVKGAYCEADVLGQVKGPKSVSFKYIRREKSATKSGHRQKYTRIKIKSVHA